MGQHLHPTYAPLARLLTGAAGGVNRADAGFGLLGFAVYHAYRHAALGRAEDSNLARRYAWRALEMITGGERFPTGIELAEATHFLRHFATQLDLTEARDELFTLLPDLLDRQMRAAFGRNDRDPYTGGFNPAYALLRAGWATEEHAGFWLTQLPTFAEMVARSAGGGYRIATNVSHGLAFHASFLLAGYDRFGHLAAWRKRAAETLGAIRRRADDALTRGCCYPRPGQRGAGSLSLTYGDAGVAYAAYRLAGALQDPDAGYYLKQLEFTAARRDPGSTQITDNGLLYGRSGALLFFRRLADLTQEPCFFAAARYWNDQAERHPDALIAPTGKVYDYATMKKVSLFEGPMGYPLTRFALTTDASFLHELFYLL